MLGMQVPPLCEQAEKEVIVVRQIAETVRGILPESLAERLISAWAVVPVGADKTPVCRTWRHGVDPMSSFTFDGLAFITGTRSGIMVLDLDSRDIMHSFTPNVVTRRGAHVWFSADGRKGGVNVLRKDGLVGVDLKAEGGYAIFTGEGKSLRHHSIQETKDLDVWFSTFPSYEESRRIDVMDLVEGLSEGIEYRTDYLEEASRLGYTVDVEWVMRTYCSQMRSRTEGERNSTLFRLAIEVARLSGDMNRLAEAAAASGLCEKEIRGTIDSAVTAVHLDPRSDDTVLARVESWRNSHALTGPVIDWVAIQAVKQNSLQPLISQSQCAEAIGRTQRGVGKALEIYERTHHIVKRITNEGTWGPGLRHSNNYKLMWNAEGR